jgi:hypothetical protein
MRVPNYVNIKIHKCSVKKHGYYYDYSLDGIIMHTPVYWKRYDDSWGNPDWTS